MGNTFFFFLAMALSLAAIPSSSSKPFFQNHLLMPQSNSGHLQSDNLINCLSWRLAVETNNLRNWRVIPEDCVDYVKKYMLDGQYDDDGQQVYEAAMQVEYARSTLRKNKFGADGKDIWIFDISETALSNLPYYERPDVNFGAKKFNSTKFGEWLEAAEAPAIVPVLTLYMQLDFVGIKAVFLCATSEKYLESRKKNLIEAGYEKWEKLILRPDALKGTSVVEYKSKERAKLEAEGYRIIGNIGDQWRDLIGTHVAKQSFKYPNPMYYTG